MKKTLQVLPMLAIVAAAALCLSFDNNGKLSILNNTNEPSELFQTQPPGKYKMVAENCTHPDGETHTYIDCQSGGTQDCEPTTCPVN